ncbi:MAG: hypothetical protein GX321_06175 [Clostridiales bacterium]|nr:hypothetical protein [Clostridiales bacterium]
MEKILIHLIPAILISFMAQLILHEIGHFIGGFISGWRFLYIQVHKIVLLRTDYRLRFKIVKDKGYRCIMYPVSLNTSGLIYTMGGCTFNLLSAITCLVVIITVSVSPVMWLYLWCFTVFGIGLYIMNGVASTKRVCNDKACYNLLKEDEHTRICHNAQLLIAKDLAHGLTYKDMRKDLICLCKDVTRNDIQAYQAVLEYYYYLDKDNYWAMGNAINKVRKRENISKEILDIMEMELNYVLLISAIKCKKQCSLNQEDIKRSINNHKKDGDIHTLKVMAVYDAYICFVERNMDKARETLNDRIKLMEKANVVYAGEKKFCVNELLKVKRIMESSIGANKGDKACVV